MHSLVARFPSHFIPQGCSVTTADPRLQTGVVVETVGIGSIVRPLGAKSAPREVRKGKGSSAGTRTDWKELKSPLAPTPGAPESGGLLPTPEPSPPGPALTELPAAAQPRSPPPRQPATPPVAPSPLPGSEPTPGTPATPAPTPVLTPQAEPATPSSEGSGIVPQSVVRTPESPPAVVEPHASSSSRKAQSQGSTLEAVHSLCATLEWGVRHCSPF